jgi:hypothetical protein
MHTHAVKQSVQPAQLGAVVQPPPPEPLAPPVPPPELPPALASVLAPADPAAPPCPASQTPPPLLPLPPHAQASASGNAVHPSLATRMAEDYPTLARNARGNRHLPGAPRNGSTLRAMAMSRATKLATDP